MTPIITGKLRKRLWIDLSVALGLGIAGGYVYWHGVHLKALRKQENFYLKLEKQKAATAQ